MCGASTLTDLAADIKKSVALHPRSFDADLCLSLAVTDLLAQGAADGTKMSSASFQVLELFAMSCPFMAVEGLGKENIPQEKSLITDLNSVPTPAVRRCCCCSFLLTAHRGRFCFQLARPIHVNVCALLDASYAPFYPDGCVTLQVKLAFL